MNFPFGYVTAPVLHRALGSALPFATRDEALAFHADGAQDRADCNITGASVRLYLIDHATGQCEALVVGGEGETRFRFGLAVFSTSQGLEGITAPFETSEQARAFHERTAESRTRNGIDDSNSRHYLIDHETGTCEKL